MEDEIYSILKNHSSNWMIFLLSKIIIKLFTLLIHKICNFSIKYIIKKYFMKGKIEKCRVT